MKCSLCGRIVPDAPFCLMCGSFEGKEYTDITRKQKRRKKGRNPNGYGSVIYKPGRTKPYMWQLSVNGKARCMGYFASPEEIDEARRKLNPATLHSSGFDLTIRQARDGYTSGQDYAKLSRKGQRSSNLGFSAWEDLAGRRLRDLKASEAQAVLDALEAAGKSSSYCAKAKTALSACYRWAMAHDMIDYNLADRLKAGGAKAEETHPFTAEQLQIILAHRGELAADIILIFCGTGMRPEELLNIKNDNRINVEGRYMLLAGSKTAAGRNRPVVFPPSIWAIFEAHRAATAQGEYIFKNKAGSRMTASNFRTHYFYPALEAYGIQPNPYGRDGCRKEGAPDAVYTPYSCRHTFYTLGDRAGMQRDILQQLGGHEKGSPITESTYIHRAPDTIRREADKIDNFFTTKSLPDTQK